LATGGAVLVIGRLVDRFGARKVILPSVLLFGLGVICLSSLSAFLWHFYALHLVLGGLAMSALIAAGLMSRLGPYRVWKAGAEAAITASVSRA